jgi:hypothetical protein
MRRGGIAFPWIAKDFGMFNCIVWTDLVISVRVFETCPAWLSSRFANCAPNCLGRVKCQVVGEEATLLSDSLLTCPLQAGICQRTQNETPVAVQAFECLQRCIATILTSETLSAPCFLGH